MRARIVAPNELTSSDLARWRECAALSVEPNPFFEPDWLLPAIEYLDESPTALIVMAEHAGAIQACMPLVEVTADRSGSGAQGKHSALETRVTPTAVSLASPLVTPQGGAEALGCAMAEISREGERRGAGLVVMEWLGDGGPIAGLMREAATDSGQVLAVFDVWERGILRRQAKGSADESYWLRNIGKNRRRTIRQHHQHLSAALEASPALRVRTDGAAVGAFLRLEASGWKGKRPGGLALWRQAATTKFFETVSHRYLESGRMCFLSLEAAEKPIAMICCVQAGEGLFAYRTSYDEELARFGPGVEIFLEAMAHFDHQTDAAWLDTCSTRDNNHMLGLFPDRRRLATVMFRVPGSAI